MEPNARCSIVPVWPSRPTGPARTSPRPSRRRVAARRTTAYVLVGLIALALTACTLFAPAPAPEPAGPVTAQWTFTVVRHAERAADGSDDPPLTDAGFDRAARLAARLQSQRGRAVYASPFRRAQSTAEPTAAAWDVPVTTYPAATRPQDVAALAQRENLNGSILIVGHSDTVPGIVSALCGCPVNPIGEDQFGNLYTVVIGTNGQVLTKLQTLDY